MNLNLLRRIDWLIDEDEFIQIVGFTGNSSALFGSSRNAIAVNKTGSPTNAGSRTVAGDAAYSVEQTRPDLVAPETWPSTATPRVGSATIFLIDAARANPSLSNGSTTNRNGDSILNAERSEVIKATLMAGAERVTNNSHPTSDPVDIIDYRVAAVNQRDNGLDRRYGAGQLNVYNSYHIIAAGEQDSVEENGTGNIASTGFDFDAAFGGSNGSNAQATYYFTTGSETVEFLVSLVWNVEIDPGRWSNFNQAAVLYNLDLQLFDVTGGGQVLVAESASVTENNENIRAFLKAGTPHMLRIKQGAGQGNFRWDYALAWRTRISGDVNGDGTIDVRDLSLFQQAIIGDKQRDKQQRARADVYPAGGDGALDVSDLITMQQLVLAD
ncbi:MAG: dockerin type I repeat-containing protein [Gammaproteobacteria bacterium]